MALPIAGAGGNAPQFLLGDPKKDYSFSFVLFPPQMDLSFKGIKSQLKAEFLDSITLLYISNLVEKVTMPSDKLDMGTVQYGLVPFQFPKGFTMSNIQVQFLEDELESVYRFHRHWMNSLKGHVYGFCLNRWEGNMSFREWGKVSLSAMYSPIKRLPIYTPTFLRQMGEAMVAPKKVMFGIDPVSGKWIPEYSGDDKAPLSLELEASASMDMPLGIEVFPVIFPIQIDRGSADKAGSGITKTTVTYVRIPIVVNGTESTWGGRDDAVKAGTLKSYDRVVFKK